MSDRSGFRCVVSGGRGIGEETCAPALVSQQGFGIRYDLDQASGVISHPDHDLCGEAVRGKVLVFTQPKGGVAASWSLAGLSERGIAPAAIIFRQTSPIFVQGAIFAGIPLMSGFAEDPCALLRTADQVLLAPGEGRVWVEE